MKLLQVINTLAFTLASMVGITQSNWMNTGGGVAYDEAQDVEVDANGNIFTTGYIGGSANFGNGQVNVTGFGFSDIYLSKSNAAGDFSWVKVFGGVDADRSYDIAIDPSGSVYMTGYFIGSADFDGTIVNSVGGSQDIFLAKFDNNGNLLWVKSEGGTDGETGYAINFDSQGNVLLTGQFKGTSTIGGSTFTSVDLPSGLSSFDIFIAKYDPNGNPIWARQGEAKFDDRGLCVSVDSDDNVYVGGQFSDTLTINGVVHNNGVMNAGFVIKLDDQGNEVWFRTLVAGQTLVRDMEFNGSDELYLTGDFQGQMSVLGGSSPYTFNGNYTYKYFVLKMDDTGSVVWDAVAGSDSELSSKAICIDGNQDVYITGTFKCVLDDYADALGDGYFNSIGFADIFVSKYSQAGVRQFSYQYGGQNADYCSGIAISQPNDPIIGGSYNKLFNFNVGSNYAVVNGTSIAINSPGISLFNTSNLCSQSGDYFCLISQGNNDIFLGKVIDLSLEPYFYQLEVNCGDVSGFCIEYVDDLVQCTDSIVICGTAATILSNTYTEGYGISNNLSPLPSVGPYYDFLWSNGSTNPGAFVTTDGNYSVQATSQDGCFTEGGSVYVDVGATVIVDTLYTDTIYPLIGLVDEIDYNDSITICEGQIVTFVGMDSLTNPSLDFDIPFCGEFFGLVQWNTIQSSGSCLFHTYTPTSTGWYTVDLSFDHAFEGPNCLIDTMHYHVVDSFYIEIIPTLTYDIEILGDTLFCPSDTVNIWVDSLLSNFSWYGPGIISSSMNGDTITVTEQGLYEYSGPSLIDSTTGCPLNTAGGTFYLYEKLEPEIWSNVSDNVICPGDSLLLTGDPGIAYEWIGPQGIAISNNSAIWVDVPGYYYCLITDSSGCTLGSNTEELIEYNTPYLLADPGTSLCFATVIELSVLHTGSPSFQWYGPVTSTSDTIHVSQPGTYYVETTQCGFTVEDSIVITPTTGLADIISGSDTLICPGDTVVLVANSGMVDYSWFPMGVGDTLYATSPGYYSVTTTSSDGCLAMSDSVLIGFKPGPPVPIINTQEGACEGDTITMVDATAIFANVEWYFDQQLISTANAIVISGFDAGDSGQYTIVHEYLGCTMDTTITLLLYPDPDLASLSVNSPLCVGDDLLLSINEETGFSYQWSGPGFSGMTANDNLTNVQLVNEGMYYLEVTSDKGCTKDDSAYVLINEYPELDIGNDTVVCEGLHYEIFAPSGYDGYLWSTGSTDTSIVVVTQNWYWLQVANANCWTVDSLQFKTKDCKVTPPNIFTPNDDGDNDLWMFPLGAEVSNPNLVIYNRWGVKVGVVNGEYPYWDGLHYKTGKELSEGVYYFIGTVINGYNEEVGLDGFIHLIRE